jgi:uncharacterized membrane protein (GlpM family)
MRLTLYLNDANNIKLKTIQGAYGVLQFLACTRNDIGYVPLDVTNATITFYGVCKEDKTQKFSGTVAASKPTLGYLEYTIQSTDFPSVGIYECEIVIEIAEDLPRKIQGIVVDVIESLSEQFEGDEA